MEFERTYTVGGVKQQPVPMQAIALVRYVKRKNVKVSHVRIFHWHASRSATWEGRARVAACVS